MYAMPAHAALSPIFTAWWCLWCPQLTKRRTVLQRLDVPEQKVLVAQLPSEQAGNFLCAIPAPAALDLLLTLGSEAVAAISGSLSAISGTKLLRAAGEEDAFSLVQVLPCVRRLTASLLWRRSGS